MTSYPAPDYPQPPAPRPAPRRKKWPWILGCAIFAAVLFVIVAAVIANNRTSAGPCANAGEHPPCAGPGNTWVTLDGKTVPRSQAAQFTPPPSYSYAESTTAAPAVPDLPEPTAKDYSVDLKVTSKQCFGSAGCNVVVEPTLNALGASTLLWECDITYSISGDDSGELVATAVAQGGTSYQVDRTSMSTKNSKVVPKATVTSVSCRKP